MIKQKIFITGGAGFIGSAITNLLAKEGHSIVVFDNQQRGNAKNLENNRNITFVQGDIRNKESVVKASNGCSTIIHLAYVNGTKFFYSKPDEVLDIGINGMLNVIEAGRRNKIDNLYLASSSEVYQQPNVIPTPEEVPLTIPDPYNPRYSYGGGKILCELMAIHMANKVFKKVIIFRPHNVYGPNMGHEHVIPEFIERMNYLSEQKSNNFEIQGTGRETRAYIYIDDFARGFLLLFKKGKNLNTYNIGNSKEVSSKELALSIAKQLNIKIKIVAGKLSTGSTTRRCPDITKIKKLGFNTSITLEKGLLLTIPYYSKKTRQ